jgi:hypothetical protein
MQPQPLEPDPDPEKINMDPKHWINGTENGTLYTVLGWERFSRGGTGILCEL